MTKVIELSQLRDNTWNYLTGRKWMNNVEENPHLKPFNSV